MVLRRGCREDGDSQKRRGGTQWQILQVSRCVVDGGLALHVFIIATRTENKEKCIVSGVARTQSRRKRQGSIISRVAHKIDV